jgi:hypothetical protein
MMETQPPLIVFKPLELQVLTNRPWYAKGQPFVFRLGSRIIHELGPSGKGSKNPTTQIRSMEKVVVKVM